MLSTFKVLHSKMLVVIHRVQILLMKLLKKLIVLKLKLIQMCVRNSTHVITVVKGDIFVHSFILFIY